MRCRRPLPRARLIASFGPRSTAMRGLLDTCPCAAKYPPINSPHTHTPIVLGNLEVVYQQLLQEKPCQ